MKTYRIPAETVLGAYRDLGGPRQEGDARLSCDPNFNRYAGFWILGETLDATHMAVETLRLTDTGQRFLDEHADALSSFLVRHYERDTGRFRTDGHARTRGIFATHAGIGVLKALAGCKSGDPITEQEYRRSLQDLTSPAGDPVDGVIALLKQAQEESPLPGTFVDNPECRLMPTVTNLSTGHALLWNLFGDDSPSELFKITDKDRTLRFLESCLKTYRVGDLTVTGFTIHPKVEELCVNTTFFALRLLKRLEFWDYLITPEIERRLVDFLELLGFRGRGFRSTLKETPSLNATYFGLKALQLLERATNRLSVDAFLDEHARHIEPFVHSCIRETTGGAGFSSDPELYPENCVATRYATRILAFLGSRVTAPEKLEELRTFCRDQYRSSGGFLPYPPQRIQPPEDENQQRWLADSLDRKDRELFRTRDWSVDSTTSGTTSEPLETLHIEIDALYEEIGDLLARQEEAPDDEELRHTLDLHFSRLEDLQAKEARTWRRQFEEGLSYPLGYGKELLDKADTILGSDARPSETNASS